MMSAMPQYRSFGLTVGTVVAALIALRTAAAPPLPSGNPSDTRFRPCLHSISYAGVWRGHAVLSVEDFLVKAKELGYEGVMLVSKRPHVSPLDYDAEARARLRKRIEELGLTLVCLAGYTDFMAGGDKAGIPNIEQQALYVGELAKLARDLGTDMVRVFTAYERPGILYDRQYGMVVEGLKLAGREAAKYDVTLAVQNHHDIALHHDQMAWLLREVNLPNVLATFDAWAPTLQGLTPDELEAAVHTMRPWLVHTIVAQYVRHPRFLYSPEYTQYVPDTPVMRAVPVGHPKGVIDYDRFFKALRSIGYRGWVVYEMCEVLEGGGSIENLDRTARAFLEYLRRYQTP